MKKYDVTIIGAGPAGLFAAFYAGMRQMSIHIIDSLPEVGGQLTALYPEKYIYDMPGFPKVLAKDLVRNLWEQAQLGKPDLSLNQKVKKIEKINEGENSGSFIISTEQGAEFASQTVILALGAGAFEPRKLDLNGLREREGQSVHYVVKDLNRFSNKEVLVIGGGDSAIDWSLAFSQPDETQCVRCKKTTLIHRGAKFTAHESTVTQLMQTSANIHLNHEIRDVKDVVHDGMNRLAVTVESNLSKEQNEIVVDHIVVCTGYVAKVDFVKEAGLTMKGNAILVNETMQTSLPGLFAIGDICTHPAKLKLIATGVGEAAIAANFAKTLVDPSAKAFPGHSTSKLGG